jgi:hypothetical protein
VTRIEFGDLEPTATKKKKEEEKKKQGYERSTDGVATRERECAIARVVLDRYGEEEEQQRRERSRNQPSTAHFFFFLFSKNFPQWRHRRPGFWCIFFGTKINQRF